ncbi:flagellar biosynthesis anti-sigma factor FlgM [Pseudobdellovibrio sp. HCB154]|uniref:flagellar biosynthesis anti-sigma factor FlgM n=1 Tax=Pseudobdellovibrio sp. HCB154 TaxID=3386277 RepID=UPI003917048F
MKITHNKVGQNLNLTDASRADKSKKSESAKATSSSQTEQANGLPFASNGDSVKVDLSARAKDIQRAKEVAMASPDVDHAKVEKFQKLIDEGKYKIDAKAIAEKMVQEHLATSRTSEE